jgi:hypothetical protein
VKKLFKWLFIICTFGVGAIFFRKKKYDKRENFAHFTCYINVWLGKKKVMAALKESGIWDSTGESWRRSFEEGRRVNIPDHWYDERAFEYVKKSPVFDVVDCTYHHHMTGWEEF